MAHTMLCKCICIMTRLKFLFSCTLDATHNLFLQHTRDLCRIRRRVLKARRKQSTRTYLAPILGQFPLSHEGLPLGNHLFHQNIIPKVAVGKGSRLAAAPGRAGRAWRGRSRLAAAPGRAGRGWQKGRGWQPRLAGKVAVGKIATDFRILQKCLKLEYAR